MKLIILTTLFLAATAQAQTVVFHEDFENGFGNWAMTGLWNEQEASESCSASIVPFPSGTHCAWYGTSFNGSCWFITSPWGPQYLTHTQPIALPATSGALLLSFKTLSETEQSTEWDMKRVQVREVGTSQWVSLLHSFNSSVWRNDVRELTPWAGLAIELRFSFSAIDDGWNDGLGWLVDDVEIREEPTTPTLTLCAADGSWLVECPCANSGGPGRGCPSSLSATGAGITSSGSLHVSSDSLVLSIDGMSESAATVFQASSSSSINAPGIAGDGVSCVNGSLIRLVTRFAPGGALTFPDVGDSPISTLGFIPPGTTRHYAARYRDSSSFCTSATFNITNTITAYWRP